MEKEKIQKQQEAVEQAHAEELAYENKRFEFKSQLKPQERLEKLRKCQSF